jgi:hypothetical protein
MNYEEAKKYSFMVPWKATECFSGPDCWCRIILPVEPIYYSHPESPDTQREFDIVDAGALDQETAEYIVKLHNEQLEKIKLDDFKKQLSQIVNEDYIESWLQKPNVAFNNRKPIDLINEDNYQPLYSMIYRLGSGEPSS